MSSSILSSKAVAALFPKRFVRALPLVAACVSIWAIFPLFVMIDLRLVVCLELAVVVTGLLALGRLRKYFAVFLALTICFFALGEGFFRVHTFGWQGLSSRFNPAQPFSRQGGFARDESTYTYLKPGESFDAGVRVTLNSRGFRDREHATEKPAGVFRIVMIGSSLSYGHGVEQSARFLDVLESKLNKSRALGKPVETISLSMTLYKFSDMLGVLRDEAPKYRPDLILVEIGDRNHLAEQGAYGRWDYWERAAGPWWHPLMRFPTTFSFFAQVFDSLFRADAAGKVPRWTSKDEGPKLEQGLRQLAKLAGRTPVGLVYLAFPIDSDGRVIPTDRRSRIQAILEAGHPELANLSLIDTTSAIEGIPARDLIIYPGDWHPNAFANEKYAEAIYRALTAK